MYRSSVVEFFTSSLGSNRLPCNLDDGPSLSKRIKRSTYWLEKIFDRAAGGVNYTHVDAFLLSLAAAKILEVQRVDGKDRWNVCRNNPYNADAGTANYLNDDNWIGINRHDETRPRKRNAHLLLNTQNSSHREDNNDDVSDGSSDDQEEDREVDDNL